MNHEILTMPEVVQRAARIKGKIYIMGPWGKWELDSFWDRIEAFSYYYNYYNSKFEYVSGNMHYISLIRIEPLERDYIAADIEATEQAWKEQNNVRDDY